LAEAETELHQVLGAADGDAPTTHYCLGRLYAKAGKLDKSIRAFQKYLAERPDAGNAKQVQAAIERMKSAISTEP
jgi:lipopolysaccharide biosynthesis regulator YciM